MKKNIFFVTILLLACSAAFAQNKLRLTVADAATKKAVKKAMVKVNDVAIEKMDTSGSFALVLKTGTNLVEIGAPNYIAQIIDFTAADTGIHTVYLQPETAQLDEVTIISSTRSSQSIENSPLKVEVLGKEEMSEEVGIRPGNIASILGDVSGVQIQQSSAVSGNSNVRIQGLSGRYTQILRDGMPLYDGFSGGFGILTIPPLDLRQIELIKGSASTLYGGGAIAGLVNLISKRPTMTQEADVVANYTSLKETDLNAYVAKRYKKVGYTLFAGYVNQQSKDVDGDGFSDVPKGNSVLVHPKLFFFPTDKTIISVGYSGTFDAREGGDIYLLNGGYTDANHMYTEYNRSERHTGEYAIEHFYNNDTKLTIKGLASYFRKLTSSPSITDYEAIQVSHYNEAALSKTMGKAELVAGINVSGDDYTPFNQPPTIRIHNFKNFTAGAFTQVGWHFKENTILEGGLRVDRHTTYGTFLLPRLAFFHRFNKEFATRLGFGMGYKTPNPFAQLDIEYNPLQIHPIAASVVSERSYGYNAEGNYKRSWGKGNSILINQAFFLTRVDHPLVFTQTTPTDVIAANETKPLVTAGFDTYLKLTIDKWEVYGGYTYTDARRTYLNDQAFVPLTSRNRMAFVLVREIEEKWRFGLEGSYFGSQYRYDGTKTPAYFFMALMVLRNFGKHFALVANCENVLDYRMSKIETLYTGPFSNPQFKPLWAPIDGRVVNVSLRWKL